MQEIIYDSFPPILQDNEKHDSLFTVLTAGYNKRKYFNDWSDSILNQLYRPLGVIYVDDCSSDKTLASLQKKKTEFLEKNVYLKIVRNSERLYCSSSYKVACESVPYGNFFGIVDADDALMKHAVRYVMSLYNKFQDISYIYTQFSECTKDLTFKKNGFCRIPDAGCSLIDMALRKQHCFSHWRTFSNRLNVPISQMWQPGLKCAVDKFMGYIMEENGHGLFVDNVCYKYRSHSDFSVSKNGQARIAWNSMIGSFIRKRVKHNIKTYKIFSLSSTGELA